MQGLSRYRHIRELQAGSTAVVHLVEDKHSGKPCAVKLLERGSCDLGTAREVGLQHMHKASVKTDGTAWHKYKAFCCSEVLGES